MLIKKNWLYLKWPRPRQMVANGTFEWFCRKQCLTSTQREALHWRNWIEGFFLNLNFHFSDWGRAKKFGCWPKNWIYSSTLGHRHFVFSVIHKNAKEKAFLQISLFGNCRAKVMTRQNKFIVFFAVYDCRWNKTARYRPSLIRFAGASTTYLS